VIVDRLQISYCEGWDPEKRQAVGSLSSVRAEERDRAGEQYTVVLSLGERPMVMIDVAWRDHYCALWLFDEQLRWWVLSEDGVAPPGRVPR
jgi:hypothetical protein